MEDIVLNNILIIICTQIILIPILGGIVYRLKYEGDKREKQIKELVKLLQLVSVAKGRRLR